MCFVELLPQRLVLLAVKPLVLLPHLTELPLVVLEVYLPLLTYLLVPALEVSVRQEVFQIHVR